jgi:hypothetical protein
MSHTHLQFLEESVEVGVPDLVWDEFKKGQQLRLLIRPLQKELLYLQGKSKS